MDELIDIVDEQGNATGRTALKSEIHKNGWYHNTIHLWLYTKEKDILLQQRSHKKKIHPLLWDVSVAGHIDAGESFEAAAVRETYEEIGLQLNPKRLNKVGIHKHESVYANGTIKDYEFHHVYVTKLEVGLDQLRPQPNEVEALKLVSISEFETLVEHCGDDNHFIASNKAYYEFVLNTIKSIDG